MGAGRRKGISWRRGMRAIGEEQSIIAQMYKEAMMKIFL